jgi:hypothetical protein
MEVLKEKPLKEISDFFKKTFEQMSISEYDTVDISEWDTVADDKCIRLIGTLIIKEDYLYKTYGKLIKNKKYEVLAKYQLVSGYLQKITIEGTLGGSLVELSWIYGYNETLDCNSRYNLYPSGNKEEFNILVPEATKIMETILNFYKIVEVKS